MILGMQNARSIDWVELAARIRLWGRELGFDAIGFADTALDAAEAELQAWLDAGFHGEMDYMASHGVKRSRPAELVPGTVSIITARMNYLPQAVPMETVLADGTRAAISRYALGRDYHKLLRARLQKLAGRIAAEIGPFGHRVFTDSAPVLEVALAERSGLGWRGKHTLLLHREAGSYFFLGEIYTDLPLPADRPQAAHCGDCRACLDVCPTQAIVAPHTVDARRCISYLTIELKGAIPIELRPLIGNRIYGCDDCQLACPWNRFARRAVETDFSVRHGLDNASLIELFAWSETEFESRLAGSAIRRIGHERWLRNLAVALGNAPNSPAIVAALASRRDHPSALVREHVAWALGRQRGGTTRHSQSASSASETYSAVNTQTGKSQ
jgi:epoxyqueuosine reductase